VEFDYWVRTDGKRTGSTVLLTEAQPQVNPILPIGQIIQGDCREVLATLPPASIDLVFADPPYNLQLRNDLVRPNNSPVDAVDDEWDHFENFQQYDDFTRTWLTACRRVLKPDGALWVIGSYHNIHRVGAILQDLNYWILNEIVWVKSNPMPNFRGVRFTNAHETLLWASRSQSAHHTFHHHAMKSLNDDLQMRSDWRFPICSGRERLRIDGKKVHSTQKPEALLYRVILASSHPGDIILDPFFGTGTTGAVAQRLGRQWIGIERDPAYIAAARKRFDSLQPVAPAPNLVSTPNPRTRDRIPFGRLLESGLLHAGDTLSFGEGGLESATIMADGSLQYKTTRGSIHQIAQALHGGPCNGWTQWYFQDPQSLRLVSIDTLRDKIRQMDEEA
jgi:site-specific DNA-methyltransferase (adenine-specific)